jgi:fibronectin type 3 domain-containing protein
MRQTTVVILAVLILACAPSANEPRLEVKLTWDASADDLVIGYNVYRSETAGRDYRRINASPLSDPRYTDTSVERGRTYYYRVTAINAAGLESGFSEERSKTVD